MKNILHLMDTENLQPTSEPEKSEMSEVVEALDQGRKKLVEDDILFSTILESSLAGYWDWNIPENYEYMSPRFKSMFGYTEEEIPNSPRWWQDNIHPEDLPKVLQNFEEHVASKGDVPYSNEVRYYHKDGSIVWVSCRGKVVEWNDQDEPIRMVGCHVDITERKQYEIALTKEEERFRLIFEKTGAGIALVGFEGTPLMSNPALTDMLGYSEEEICKMSFSEFTHPDDVEKDMSQYMDLVSGKIKSYSMEKRYIRKDGEILWGHLTVSLQTDPVTGEPMYAIGTVVDITDQRKAATLEQINKELSEFAHITSHDLQEPLRTITSYIDLLNLKHSDSFNEEVQQYLGYIKGGAMRMIHQIRALLEYSQLGRDKKAVSTDVGEVLEVVLNDLQAHIQDCQAEVETDKMPTLVGYPTELRLLFQNLISNSLKFAHPDRKPRIQVSVEAQPGLWKFSVADNGVGIDKKFFERIFIIFQRLQDRPSTQGTGIGLAHCKKIVNIHGGDIWVESQEGIGTTFYFTIPVLKEED
ncbi:MAG: PAS domain S-box protein [Flavobacteriales bacterium]|nr:PAS domain S-box protein [Flavobacteriales bacterium]